MSLNEFLDLLKAVAAFLWPIAFVIIALCFRKEIKAVLGRIKSFNASGVTVNTEPVPAPQTDAKEFFVVAKLAATFEKPFYRQQLADVEEFIQRYKPPTDADQIKVLKQYAAIAKGFAHFEECGASIYGTQLNLLIRLQSMTAGMPIKEISEFHAEHVKLAEKHASSFGEWINYLKSRLLVIVKEDLLYISDDGIEFLHWLIDLKKTFPRRF